jgi:tRNA threonylcarbamoyladenosine dehydratase
LTRTSSFLTPNGLAKLRSTFVIVVGLGGVGSHCTASLVRSGVAYIRVVDFDQVTLSSLNRHAVATLADVGTPKVQCVKRRLEAVVPWVHWEIFNEIWREDQADRLLGPFGGSDGQQPDYVVDAIDNIDSKVALLKCCYARGIKVVSSMGAGCKSDPTRVMIGDISATIEDPLSKATRRRLRLLGISEGIPVIFSTEKPGPGKAKLLPLPEKEFEKGSVGDLSVLPDFRVRILPVLGTMPAVFGYVIANFIILEVSHYPHEAWLGKTRDKLYDSMLGTLQGTEERLARSEGDDAVGLRITVSKDDVGFIVDEVFRGKSVISGLFTRLVLIRWRAPIGGFSSDASIKGQKVSSVQLQDLVCMTKEEAAVHEKQVLRGRRAPETVYSSDILARVESRFREERAYAVYR